MSNVVRRILTPPTHTADFATWEGFHLGLRNAWLSGPPGFSIVIQARNNQSGGGGVGAGKNNC